MLHREALGAVIRLERQEQGLMMRDIPNVALGYLSEVERGQKEASSETVQLIAKGLGRDVALLYYYAANYLHTNGARYKPKEASNEHN